jgi:hypothetical protein
VLGIPSLPYPNQVAPMSNKYCPKSFRDVESCGSGNKYPLNAAVVGVGVFVGVFVGVVVFVGVCVGVSVFVGVMVVVGVFVGVSLGV